MSELYNRIDRLCKERGTNVTALCRKAGVARSLMSELNMGRTKTITLDTAAKLADALGIMVDELNGLEPQNENVPADKGEDVSDDDIKFALFGGAGEITDEMYNEVKNFAQYVKQREHDKQK